MKRILTFGFAELLIGRGWMPIALFIILIVGNVGRASRGRLLRNQLIIVLLLLLLNQDKVKVPTGQGKCEETD
jgi:hypothetical protein